MVEKKVPIHVSPVRDDIMVEKKVPIHVSPVRDDIMVELVGFDKLYSILEISWFNR